MVMTLLAIITVLACMISDVQGCKCRGFQHFQRHFCSSKYVLYGRVITEKSVERGSDLLRRYTIRILYKMKGVSESVGSEVDIETPNQSASCGVKLEVGNSYILMGTEQADGTKTIISCDFPTHLGSLSPYQAFYMFTSGPFSYKLNCRRGCNKIDEQSEGCKLDRIGNELTACLSKHALCKKQGRTCVWFHNNKC
ncbi:uncharacterized protein LOC127710848 [Mytilus californianus]|uniref:uncharacterized protein LOC127710848 n=1 Tax=Mytilus californianus TaxID=6549 RepID=UPI0022460729|nr:uncharacterized protein LOC127710848 [Mytilus californianus]